LAKDGKSVETLAAENELIREGIALNEKNLKIAEKKLLAQEEYATKEAANLEKRRARQAQSLQDRTAALAKDEVEIANLEKKARFSISFGKRMELHEEVAERTMEISKETLSIQEAKLKLMKDVGKASDEEIKKQEQKIRNNKKQIKTNEKNLKLGNEAVSQGKTMLKNLGARALGSSKLSSAIMAGGKGLHSMWKMAKGLNLALKAGAISASTLTAALGIGIILLVVGAIAKLVEWTIGLAVKTRDAAVAFQRATGAAAKFGAAIPALEYNMRAVGVSMEEATAAQNALYTSTTDYTMASAGARKDLLKTTALMGEFGVSVGTSAKIAQHATKGLGIGIGGADELLLGLSAHAQDIGVPISKMAEDFAASANELKRFGNDGERVFKRLAMVSKVTGMEIGRILAITEKFDTFEGAAKQAGQLNAAIGGNMVNAMDLMMTTDPVDRFNMIRDSILDAAGSFDDMSYYQKKFYANAAGLKDVGELAAMMSGDMGALDGNIGQTSKSYADQRAKAKSWQTTMEILKNTLTSFLPTMQKLQKPLQKMLDAFADGEGPLKELGKSFEYLMEELLIPGMLALPDMIKDVISKFTLVSDWLNENRPMIKGFADDMKALAVFMWDLSYPTRMFWKLLLMMGVGISKFWASLKKRNSPSFLDLFTGGVLEKGFKLASKAIELFFAPIVALGKMLKSLGHMLAETFNFAGIKTSVTDFVKWIPGEWAESLTGIKTEMEISSPSKRMEREVMDPTFVQPMQSVAAKMPKLVDDVYGDVPAMAAKNLKPLTATPQKLQPGLQETRFSNADYAAQRAQKSAFRENAGATPAQAGPQTTQVSIPISIGKDQLGTVVTEIVDGRLGAVSYQGMASTGGIG